MQGRPPALVRARHLKEWLDQVQTLEPSHAGRFLDQLGDEVVATVRGATSVSWLAAELHARCASALLGAFGARRAHEYYRRSFARALEGPLLGPIVRAGVAMFGLSPAAFVRWAEKGWQASFRDAGSLRGEVLSRGHGRLVYEHLPPECVAHAAWLESFASTAYGVFDVTHTGGVVRTVENDPGAGRFALELEWST